MKTKRIVGKVVDAERYGPQPLVIKYDESNNKLSIVDTEKDISFTVDYEEVLEVVKQDQEDARVTMPSRSLMFWE
jgi:dihydroneopterin aldolase